ncbi:MAG TPA: TIGR02281 family clan AA aspartic protease [Allosphingosinicella sp.]
MILVGLAIGWAWPSQKADSDVGSAATVAKPASDSSEPFSSDAPPETHLRRQDNGHFYVDAEVNGRIVRFVVDTGASIVALTEEDARRIGIPFDPAEFQIVGKGASGDVRGASIMLSTVSVEGKKVHDVRGAIIQGGSVSLLGQSYLSALTSVNMSRDTMTLR